MSHTKGPWAYGVRSDGSIWLSIGNPVNGRHRQADIFADPDDARLIAAAPELLDALRVAYDSARIFNRDGDSVWDERKAFILAAIAKATGGAL